MVSHGGEGEDGVHIMVTDDDNTKNDNHRNTVILTTQLAISTVRIDEAKNVRCHASMGVRKYAPYVEGRGPPLCVEDGHAARDPCNPRTQVL